jgi:hypothetical protein
MPDILIAILIIIVLVSSIIGLLYVGSKFLLNVSTDISNIPKQTNTSNIPTLPTLSTLPNAPQISTSISSLPPNTLETWSQNNFQGDKLLSLLLTELNDGYNLIAVSNVKSIRFPSTGYDVYIMTQSQYDTVTESGNISTNYVNNSTKIDYNSPSINNISVAFVVIIKISPTTTAIPTTTTRMGDTYTSFTNSLCAIDSYGTSPYIYNNIEYIGVCKIKCNNNPLCSGYVTEPYNSIAEQCILYGTNITSDDVFNNINTDVPFKAGERVRVGYQFKKYNSDYTCYLRNNT